MFARSQSLLLLAALLGMPTVANRPMLVFPQQEDLFPASSSIFIEDIADIDRVAKTRPGDAAELRDLLDALSHKAGETAKNSAKVQLRQVNADMNPYVLLASYPTKQYLSVTVNGNGYRLELGVLPHHGISLARYFDPPNRDRK